MATTRLQRVSDRVLDRVVNPVRVTDQGALRRRVEGKTVLVTGASFGLGESAARMLAAAGATVLVVARTAERLDELVAEIGTEGGHAVAYPCDLSDIASVEVLIEKVLADHGAPDIIVNNAGKSLRRSLDLQYDRYTQDYERMTYVNYLGPLRLMLGLLPGMRERGSGQIVNVSTIGVRIPPGPRWGSYQASKGAFDTWMRSVTPELASDGISVSTIYMALIYTRMSAPTPIMRKLPGLDPDEAAGLIARAIVKREREITPWWVTPAQGSDAWGRGVVARGMGLMYRHSTDSASALGQGRPGDAHPKAGSK